MTIDQAIGQLPDHIPLGEIQPDGTVRPGILIRNDTTRVMTTISKAHPVGVVLQPTGEWTIRDGGAQYDDTYFVPGHSEIIPGSEVIELCRAVSLGSEFARPIHEGFQPRVGDISWTYDPADQSPDRSSLSLRTNQFITRADVAGLDLMGWNADPTLVPLVNAGQVDLIAPVEMAQVSPNQPITFKWSGDTYICWVVQVYAGTDAGADDSDNVFFATDNLPPQQTSFQVPADVVFPPGTYSWYVVSYTQTGYITSEARVFVVEASCDPDVNQDGNTDQTDIEYFINVVAGGPNPTGIDPDFNQDGNVDSGDTDALINVVAGGACP